VPSFLRDPAEVVDGERDAIPVPRGPVDVW
jgi:hypothetical protein